MMINPLLPFLGPNEFKVRPRDEEDDRKVDRKNGRKEGRDAEEDRFFLEEEAA